jgi:type III restriction enzyme
MCEHSWEVHEGFEPRVTPGYRTLQVAFQAPFGEPIRSFRDPVAVKQDIPKMVFGGFKRCLFSIQKFSSDPERVLAMILENEREDLKWVKPPRGQFQIHYRYQREEHQYEPDFVVETAHDKFLLEPKMASQVEDAKVKAKAEAARTWCEAASGHAQTNGGKPWTYILVPHDAIQENMTLKGLVAAYGNTSIIV